MISAIFRHLLSLAVYTLIFVPLLTVFPIFSLATPFIIWLQCAVKSAGPQREINPSGNWIAPPGSNRSGGGDNKAVGASGVEGRVRRLGESVGRNVSER